MASALVQPRRPPACLRQAQLLQAGEQGPQVLLHIQDQRLRRRLQHQGGGGDAAQALLLEQEGVDLLTAK